MKHPILSLGIVAFALTSSAAALADVHLNVDINPFGWGVYPPPLIYEPPRYYSPPPVIYYGRGQWGDRRDARGRHYDRGRPNQHDRGHDRR